MNRNSNCQENTLFLCFLAKCSYMHENQCDSLFFCAFLIPMGIQLALF